MMLNKQNIHLLGVALLVLAMVDWKAFIVVCKLLFVFIGTPYLLLLLFAVIVLLYCAIVYSIVYARKGAAKIRAWLFN